jgi:hypothetical protein
MPDQIKRTRTLQRALSFIFLAGLFDGPRRVVFCNASLLHPNDLAIGKWKLSLRRRDRSLFETIIFPSVDGGTQSLSNCIQKRKRRLDCELTLSQNGTFTLQPSVDGGDNELTLPLKGHWLVRPNPYCITDRHYDELCLLSLPKVRQGDSDTSVSNDATPERLQFELRGKVWGRYGSNSIREFLNLKMGRDAGRITHGSLSIVKMDDTVNRNEEVRRILCATFRGQASG